MKQENILQNHKIAEYFPVSLFYILTNLVCLHISHIRPCFYLTLTTIRLTDLKSVTEPKTVS